MVLYTYVLRIDDGAAPNPYGETCTLTICKPGIRRKAHIGDWVIGTGSKHPRLKKRIPFQSDSIVYAMKISRILSLEEYDKYCKKYLPIKIPIWFSKHYEQRVGDCIYEFNVISKPQIRLGIHNRNQSKHDLSGENALLSDEFYYFGEKPILLPQNLLPIIKKGRGYKITHEPYSMQFETWIRQFEKNKIYADPQLKFLYEQFYIDKINYKNKNTIIKPIITEW